MNKQTIKNTIPGEDAVQDLSDLFQMFSDPTRLKILFALRHDSLCVADITAGIEATQSAVSHQLRILKRGRLVKSNRRGKQVFYELSDDHVYTLLEQGIEHINE